MFNRLKFLATGATAGIVFGLISHAPSAHAHEKHDHDKHHHGKHHGHQIKKQKAFNYGYRHGYNHAQKYVYRPARVVRPVYRPVVRSYNPVVVKPYRVTPHRSWVSLGFRFPI